MTEISKKDQRKMKFQANKGVGDYILDLLKDQPHTSKTKHELFLEVIECYPNADLKTVGNALSNLHRKKLITKLPSVKGIRGARWAVALELAPFSTQPPSGLIEPGLSASQIGEAIITSIRNMKEVIRKQSEKVDQLLNTLQNRGKAWDAKERELRDKIIEKTKIIESLQLQLEPDPEMTFKLEEIAEFSQLEK